MPHHSILHQIISLSTDHKLNLWTIRSNLFPFFSFFFFFFSNFFEYNKFENSSTHVTFDTIYNRVNPLGCDNLVYKEVKCKHWYRNVEEEEEGGGGINVKQIIDLILSRLWNGIEENVSRESSLKADKLQGLGGGSEISRVIARWTRKRRKHADDAVIARLRCFEI